MTITATDEQQALHLEDRRRTYAEMRDEIDVYIDEQAVEHVQRGIALLKEKFGEDFVEHIDPKTLQLSDGSQCVLGQLYGEYGVGLHHLDIADGSFYGFDSNGASYSELDAAWIHELEKELATR